MKTQTQIELDAEIMDVLVDTMNELVSESGLEGEVCQGYQEALVVHANQIIEMSNNGIVIDITSQLPRWMREFGKPLLQYITEGIEVEEAVEQVEEDADAALFDHEGEELDEDDYLIEFIDEQEATDEEWFGEDDEDDEEGEPKSVKCASG